MDTGLVMESRFGRVIGVVARNHALTRLLFAYLVMIVAEFGEWLAVIVYAYVRGGASAAGLVVIVQLIPSMFLAPLISAQLARIGVARLLACAYAAATAALGCCGVAILAGAPVCDRLRRCSGVLALARGEQASASRPDAARRSPPG